MRSKKSRFWSFWLSFVPGCAEMYMGFMKMGMSLMLAFWGILAVAVVLNIGPMMFLEVIVWFYSFFHARNLAHMNEPEFMAAEDNYLYNIESLNHVGSNLVQGYRKIVAIVLVILGITLVFRGFIHMVWDVLPPVLREMYYSMTSYLPQIIVGCGIIAIGVLMIKGKQQELWKENEDGSKQEDGFTNEFGSEDK